MAGNTYAVSILNADGTYQTRTGEITFPSATAQPASNTNAVTSGALSQLSAWVSGTAKVNPVSYPINVVIAPTGDATNNAATVDIALSPDNSTFTTVATWSLAAAVNTLGAVTTVNTVNVPTGWYIKLTIGAHATVAQSYYY